MRPRAESRRQGGGGHSVVYRGLGPDMCTWSVRRPSNHGTDSLPVPPRGITVSAMLFARASTPSDASN
jgi:hypothetical protein